MWGAVDFSPFIYTWEAWEIPQGHSFQKLDGWESCWFYCCEFLLDLYVCTSQKHHKEAADVCVISRRKQTPSPVGLSVQQNSALLQGRCWLSTTGNLGSLAPLAGPFPPLLWMWTRPIIHVSGNNHTSRLHKELNYMFLCWYMWLKHTFLEKDADWNVVLSIHVLRHTSLIC